MITDYGIYPYNSTTSKYFQHLNRNFKLYFILTNNVCNRILNYESTQKAAMQNNFVVHCIIQSISFAIMLLKSVNKTIRSLNLFIGLKASLRLLLYGCKR